MFLEAARQAWQWAQFRREVRSRSKYDRLQAQIGHVTEQVLEVVVEGQEGTVVEYSDEEIIDLIKSKHPKEYEDSYIPDGLFCAALEYLESVGAIKGRNLTPAERIRQGIELNQEVLVFRRLPEGAQTRLSIAEQGNI